MRKSRARQALEAALAAAKTTAGRAEYATKLANLVERESRTKARDQRRKAKAAKVSDAQPEPLDLDAPFELDPWPTVITQPVQPPAPVKLPATAPEATEPAKASAFRPLRPVNGVGWSRTTPTAEPPIWWDAYQGCFMGQGENGAVRARFPEPPTYQSDLEDEFATTGRLTFSGGEFENKRGKQRAEDEAFRQYADKMGWGR